MFHVIFINRRFSASYFSAALALLAILFLVYLGVWQLKRAHEKNKMLHHNTVMQQQPALHWSPILANPQQYQPVSITGHYLKKTLFLDNQHYQHQFGYDVLTPMQLPSGGVVLVDRGWIRADNNRLKLPEVTTLDTPQLVEGQAYYPSNNPFVLGQVFEKKSENLAILENIDFNLVRQFLQKPVYPFIIRLNKKQAGGFVREWPIVSMTPQRHYGYALQWFAMAFIGVIIFISLHLKKINEH
jgi:surfeit locus 1 family protein